MTAMPDKWELEEISEFLRLFADPTRLRILFELLNHSLCVNHICEHTGISQSAISHQLAIMRRADIVKCERSGKSMVYSVADGHIAQIIDTARKHIEEGSDN